MIKETTIYDFKTHLSRYIRELEEGKYEFIRLKRRDQTVGEFHFKKPAPKKVRLGTMRGDRYVFDKALFDSGDDEIADLMNNGPIFPDEDAQG